MRRIMVAAALVMLAAHGLAGQDGADRDDPVLEAAVRALLDDREEQSIVLALGRNPRASHAVRAALGLEVREASAVISCTPEKPPACHIPGGETLIHLGEPPRVRGDRAEVSLGVSFALDGARQIARQIWVVTLHRTRAGWSVVDKRLTIET